MMLEIARTLLGIASFDCVIGVGVGTANCGYEIHVTNKFLALARVF